MKNNSIIYTSGSGPGTKVPQCSMTARSSIPDFSSTVERQSSEKFLHCLYQGLVQKH